MYEAGPGGQEPFTDSQILRNQGFTVGGAGRLPSGAGDTDIAPGVLCVFSPTARVQSTSIVVAPQSLRESQRYSTTTLAKGLKEVVAIRLGYTVAQGTDAGDDDEADRQLARANMWQWRRIVIRTKVGGPFMDPGSGGPDAGVYSALRLIDAEHVRPVVPNGKPSLLNNIYQSLFASDDQLSTALNEGWLKAVVDSNEHSVLYDKVINLRPPIGGTSMRFDFYHAFDFMMEYNDESVNDGYARSDGRSQVQWGDVFIFDWFECCSGDPRAQLSVDMPASRYYWHEQPI